jgi:hypothetical protein
MRVDPDAAALKLSNGATVNMRCDEFNIAVRKRMFVEAVPMAGL